jgi:hypothetical protein
MLGWLRSAWIVAEEIEQRPRVEISFRCSDAAYERLFRRMPRHNGGYRGRDRRAEAAAADQSLIDETRPGDRFGAILTRFLDAVERDPGIVLLHPKSEQPQRVRKLWIDAEIKQRFDERAATAPVGREVLMREAIFRFTSKS